MKITSGSPKSHAGNKPGQATPGQSHEYFQFMPTLVHGFPILKIKSIAFFLRGQKSTDEQPRDPSFYMFTCRCTVIFLI